MGIEADARPGLSDELLDGMSTQELEDFAAAKRVAMGEHASHGRDYYAGIEQQFLSQILGALARKASVNEWAA